MQRDVFLIVSAVSAVIDIWLGLLQLQGFCSLDTLALEWMVMVV